MATIVKQRERIAVRERVQRFHFRSDPAAGFSFDIGPDGEVLLLSEALAENYRRCTSGEYDVIDCGIVQREYILDDPALLACDCGHYLPLATSTNRCSCGARYSRSGKRLTPQPKSDKVNVHRHRDLAALAPG